MTTREENLRELARLERQHEEQHASLGLKIVKAVRSLAASLSQAGFKSGLEVRLSDEDFKALEREMRVTFSYMPPSNGESELHVETACGTVKFIRS